MQEGLFWAKRNSTKLQHNNKLFASAICCKGQHASVEKANIVYEKMASLKKNLKKIEIFTITIAKECAACFLLHMSGLTLAA